MIWNSQYPCFYNTVRDNKSFLSKSEVELPVSHIPIINDRCCAPAALEDWAELLERRNNYRIHQKQDQNHLLQDREPISKKQFNSQKHF